MASKGINCSDFSSTDSFGTESLNQEVEILETLAVAPNPLSTEAIARFSVKVNAEVVLKIFDYNGREIQMIHNGAVKAYEIYDVPSQRNNMMSGVYILKLTAANGQSYEKQFIVE